MTKIEVAKEIGNYLTENNLGELDYLVKCTNSNYIYGVVAWKDGEYRCWTHYNTELHSMNCGHYGLKRIDECLDVFNEIYGVDNWVEIGIYAYRPVLFDERFTEVNKRSASVFGHYRCICELHGKLVDMSASKMCAVLKTLDLYDPLFFAIEDKSRKNLLNESSISDKIFCLCQKYQGEIIGGVSVAVILNHRVLRKIERLIGAFYLLPSSRFEWIIVSANTDVSSEGLIHLVQECNANQDIVKRADVLSDQVLLFANGKLTVA